MKKIVTLGLGKVGSLVGLLLSKKFDVTGVDIQHPHYHIDLPFPVVEGDVTSVDFLKEQLADCDAVVSALPFALNKKVVEVAHEMGKHYFDLTEDVETSNYIRKLAETSKGVMAPQCGLGTMCETYEGKVDTLNYKSIRYPGHGKLMRFLMYELILKNDIDTLKRILVEAKPPVKEDVVYVYAVVEGWQDEKLLRNEYFKAFHPIEIDGKEWRAISWTTAASAAAVVEMVADGLLPNKGFIKQEEISFDKLLETTNGAYFK